LTALKELTDVLLSIDEFAYEPTRWQIIRLMPQEIASSVSSFGNQRLQVISLLQACDKSEGGPAALVEVLRTVLPNDTQCRKAEEVIGRIWPASIA
jgi:hypothetical protein